MLFRSYDEVVFPAKPGDVLVFYSDGIEDQLDPGDDEYGQKRLARLVLPMGNRSAGDIAESVFADVDRHAAGEPRTDDQTLIVLKVN